MSTRQTVSAPRAFSTSLGRRQAIYVLVTLIVLAALAAGTFAALWVASFFLYASLRLNPLHAGLLGWFDAVLAWHDGRLPKDGRRLAGAAVAGVLIAFGGPGLGLYSLWDRSDRRRLYGSARFASEAEIRSAGLL